MNSLYVVLKKEGFCKVREYFKANKNAPGYYFNIFYVSAIMKKIYIAVQKNMLRRHLLA